MEQLKGVLEDLGARSRDALDVAICGRQAHGT
jgi:hypothetical protein